LKHLYFIRHGQTVLNAERKWAGHTDTPLTEEGKAQAKAAGKAAKSLHINHIISSPLSRAHDTAKIIAASIGLAEKHIEVNSLIIERHMGELESQPWDIDIDLDGFADIETEDSVDERARLILRHLTRLDADTILMVSHGGFGHALWRIINEHNDVDPIGHFANAEIIKLI
jgi:uncharacterized phosphatase